jgi:plasmid maintenance system antidote protein VapI
MTLAGEFRPNWASAPGDTIADVLGERGWSIDEFAKRIGQPLEHADDLLRGRAAITIRIARQLERVLGGSVEFWMARDGQFREDIAMLQTADREWLRELPLRDMIRFGWLQPIPHPSEEVQACLRFFAVPAVAIWRQLYEPLQTQAAFRTSPTFDSRPAAVAAWLRQGEIESTRISCAPWDPDHFRGSLNQIRRLTLEKDPTRFVPALKDECASAGVALAIVRAPQGCPASGATRFMSPEKALLLLSFRYLSDDQFWFTFFHEAGHILLHGHEKVFLEGLDNQSGVQEQEANEFAERVLIPQAFRDEFLRLPGEMREIIKFAKRVGIAPGIVVGQMQHYQRIRRNHFNGLKRRFQWRECE